MPRFHLSRELHVQSSCPVLLHLRSHRNHERWPKARSAGAAVDVKRVPETVPEAIAGPAHFKATRRRRRVAAVADLEHYDVIVGCPALRPPALADGQL